GPGHLDPGEHEHGDEQHQEHGAGDRDDQGGHRSFFSRPASLDTRTGLDQNAGRAGYLDYEDPGTAGERLVRPRVELDLLAGDRPGEPERAEEPGDHRQRQFAAPVVTGVDGAEVQVTEMDVTDMDVAEVEVATADQRQDQQEQRESTEREERDDNPAHLTWAPP